MATAFRLVLTFVLIAVTAPTLADYKTCLTHCMTQHEFDHCHPLCASMAPSSPLAGDGADQSDIGAPSRDGEGAGQCNTPDEKMDALEAFIVEYYGTYGYLHIFPLGGAEEPFETAFYPRNKSCEGIVTVDQDCRIDQVEEIRCEASDYFTGE